MNDDRFAVAGKSHGIQAGDTNLNLGNTRMTGEKNGDGEGLKLPVYVLAALRLKCRDQGNRMNNRSGKPGAIPKVQ
jgi:hypothetical protein